MLVPFTVNGIALREAFFVSFLGKLHVPADAAFATGFLFFSTLAGHRHPGGTDLGRRRHIRPSAKDIVRRIRN